MLAALRAGRVDAIVDDDVALIPVAEEPDLEVAFTVPTRNPWGIAVSKQRPELRAELDHAMDSVLADGTLAALWQRWMPQLAFPL